MTTWSTVSKDGSTWSEVYAGGSYADLPFGSGPFGGGGVASQWSAVDKDDSSWSDVDKKTSTWAQEPQSGTLAATFNLNEPLGGPEWAVVDKDE